jgi:leucyl aminopeptidase
MKINVSKKKLHDLVVDLTVIPVAAGSESGGAVRELSRKVRDAVVARIEMTGFRAKAGKTLNVQTDGGDMQLVGLGSDHSAEAYRRAAAKGAAAAAGRNAKSVVVAAGSGATAKKVLGPIVEGYLLGSYRFDKYKSKASKNDDARYAGPNTLTVAGGGLTAGVGSKNEIERAKSVCEGVCLARDLINEMSKVKTPTFLAKTAKQIAKAEKLKCEVWQGARLEKEKMNGILAVSAGSAEPGALIKLVYTPRKKTRAKVAIVGKGITFDSGGGLPPCSAS